MFIIRNQGKLLGSSAVRTVLITAIFAIIIAFTMNPTQLMAQDANDTMTLDINVSEVAIVELSHTEIVWEQMAPNSNGTVYNITISNQGSFNITNFYVSVNTVDLETSNPVGTGDIGLYAASGFIIFRNETATTDFFHLGRLEWNLTELLEDEDIDISAGVTNFSHGWYRKSSGNEYLWKVENGTGGYCNETDTNFVIAKNPENSSGYSRDLSTGVATATADSENANWTFFHFTAGEGGPLEGHCVATHVNCTKIYVYKYDKSAGFGDCVDAHYVSTENLVPGDSIQSLKLKTAIPQGTPAGDAIQSTMIIYSSIA